MSDKINENDKASSIKNPNPLIGNYNPYEINEDEDVSEKDKLLIQKAILENDVTEFIPANIRNVLFCGASKAGKSTLFHIMQNPVYCPEKITMFSDTRYTCFKTFTLRDKKENKIHNFVVSLIDTPGTFELRSTKEEFVSRSNDQISNLIIDCINHEVTYLNLLCLVMNANKFSEAEIDSVDLFLNLFGKTKIPIILCLTNADMLKKSRREAIEKELKEHPRFASYFNDGLFIIQWSGCVNYNAQNYTNTKVMETAYKLVANWRNEFMNRIFSAEQRVDLELTDIYVNKRKQCIELLDLILKEMNTYIDIDLKNMTGGQQLGIINHTQNMNFLFDHAFYMVKEREMSIIDKWRLFTNFCSNIQNSTKDENVKQAILGKWYK